MKTRNIIALAIPIGIFVLLFVRARLDEKKEILRFAPPPEKPNCVSTEVPETHPAYIAPIATAQNFDEIKATLIQEITRLPGAKLAVDDGGYLRFEFRSRLFQFIDDVEFKIDGSSKTLRMRSASRTGHSDFGVNRKRIENVRALLQGKI